MPPSTLSPFAPTASVPMLPPAAEPAAGTGSDAQLFARANGNLAAYLAAPSEQNLLAELWQSLRAAASACARLPRHQTTSELLASARTLLRAVASSGVYDARAEASDVEFASALGRKGWPGQIGAMLLVPAWQLPAAPALKSVPDWLWPDYVRYLFSVPQGFCEIGDAEAFASHYERRLAEFVGLVERAPSAPSTRTALAAYIQVSNFIPLYFSGGSLRRHAELRGKLFCFAFVGKPDRASTPVARENRRLRVGIINRHFGPQTETYSTLPTFEQLDPDRFEVILFAHQAGESALENYCREHAADFVVLPPSPDAQLDTLRAAALDIAVFGTNVTAVFNEVTRLALHRVAPLQVVNNSSCITSGLPEIDLYVSGTLTEAPDAPAHFSERLGLLPGPAHAFNYLADRQEPRIACFRSDFNLPDDAFVYVSAANYFKIVPEMQQAWARLLASVPGSYLLLHPFNPNWASSYPIERFRAEFSRVLSAHGVDPRRLALSSQRFPSRTDVKSLLALGDVYLDTFPFGGVNSLVDPLELGLPVVVWEGGPFRSRMGGALLRSLDFAELIATDEAAYRAIAVRLATDPAARGNWRARIGAKMEGTPIFLDPLAASDAFGDLLEAAFDELVRVGAKAFRAARAPLYAVNPAAAMATRPASDPVERARATLRVSPADADARHRIGRALLEAGQTARAVTYLLAALQGAEAKADLWIDVASALRANAQLPEALQALEAGLRVDQTRLDGWTMFAEIAGELGATDIADEARGVANQLTAAARHDGRRHVLLYTDDPGAGGVAQYNHNLLLALTRAGYRVSCVQTRAENPLVAEQAAAGVQHHWLDYHTSENFVRTMTDATLAEKLFDADRPDLVIFSDCCPVSNLAAREAALVRDLPYVVVVGFVGAYLAKNFSDQLDQLARQYAAAREVVAVAEENLHLLHTLFGTPRTKGTVIHYGRPPSYFQPRRAEVREHLRAELGLPAEAVVAFTAARLTGVKGFDLQLQAIVQLRALPVARHLHFVWAGEGDQRAAIAAAIAKLGLGDRVHLLGQRWDVAEWLDAADIFVLPSRLEGMPLCLMEAMAKGLPVIATAVSGIPEELGDAGQLLTDPAVDPKQTVAELVRTLAQWAPDAAFRARLGALARARAEKLFRADLMIERTLALVARQLPVAAATVSDLV